MTQPRITIITPCYNQGRYIESTLCSVLDQGYENLEYFVVDRGSTDDTRKIVDLYKGELTWLTNEHFTGPAEAINKAIARATGDIIGVLHADDLYLPGALDMVTRSWMAPDAPRWLVGHATTISSDDQMQGRLDSVAPTSLAAFLMHNARSWPMCTTFWDRHFTSKYGPFNTGLHFSHEYDFWCRLLANGHQPTVVAGQELAAHRKHTDKANGTTLLQQGLETISTAVRYASHLPLRERLGLWANCDLRRRIYTLAEAELNGKQALQPLIKQVLRHPWWLANELLRRTLLHGVDHPVPAPIARRAA